MATRSGKVVGRAQLKEPQLKLHLLATDITVASPSPSKKVQFALQRNQTFGKCKLLGCLSIIIMYDNLSYHICIIFDLFYWNGPLFRAGILIISTWCVLLCNISTFCCWCKYINKLILKAHDFVMHATWNPFHLQWESLEPHFYVACRI